MTLTVPPWTIYDTGKPLQVGIKGFSRKNGATHVAYVIMPEDAELIVTAVNNYKPMLQLLIEFWSEYSDTDDPRLRELVELARKLIPGEIE